MYEYTGTWTRKDQLLLIQVSADMKCAYLQSGGLSREIRTVQGNREGMETDRPSTDRRPLVHMRDINRAY